jgi:hypothetical protein
MARKRKHEEEEGEGKNYSEGELVLLFKLNRITDYATPTMQEWLDVETPVLTPLENELFAKKHKAAQNQLSGWSEEDLKMKFITYILELGYLENGNGFVTLFDKMIYAKVEGVDLKVKSDFMVAKGLLDYFTTPYFHFQEYKPHKKPSGDSMAQLLQALLIAQTKNKKTTPLYGIEIIGDRWTFVVMEGKEYCVSKNYSCIDKEDLLNIIAILRKFRWILETRLMKDEE